MKSIKPASNCFQSMLHRMNSRNAWEIIFNLMKSFNRLLNSFSRNPSFPNNNNNNEYKKISIKFKIYSNMNYQAYLYSLNKSINEPKLYLTT